MLQNSESREVTQDTPPPKNPVELLINEACHGFRRESIDVGPLQVVAEEEILNDMPLHMTKNFLSCLKMDGKNCMKGLSTQN